MMNRDSTALRAKKQAMRDRNEKARAFSNFGFWRAGTPEASSAASKGSLSPSSGFWKASLTSGLRIIHAASQSGARVIKPNIPVS